MFGLRAFFNSTFHFIEHQLQWITNSDNRKKAATVLVSVIDGVEHAAPIVQALADATQFGKIADILIPGIMKAGIKAEDLLRLEQKAEASGDAADWHLLIGTVSDVGGESLRAVLRKIVASGTTVEALGQVFHTVEQVDAILPHQLQTVVSVAYTAARAGSVIVKTVSETPADVTAAPPAA